LEIEFKEKELTDLQLRGLLRATQGNKNYASKLNHGASEKLDDAITSNKYNLKRKMIEFDLPSKTRYHSL
ncbi:19492_t:CDS:2, partial [Gigaspora margarita]